MDSISYKTLSANRNTVEKQWIVVDVQGLVLGRAASRVAHILRGKHKPSFTPHVDCGDYVIVINADKIRLTGRKLQQKEYVHYTGFMGGQRFTSASKMLTEKPERMFELAVKRMLPKNRLGDTVLGNLRVYAGAEHPHVAQQPIPHELVFKPTGNQ